MSLRLITALLLVLIVVLCLPIISVAENNPEQVVPIVVTASRVAQTVDDTLIPVTVITREDIERIQAQSLVGLLNGQLGISLSNNGGPGKVTSFFLRGSNSDHVLVLVDGIKIGSATTGTVNFQDIPIALIDHIEIVRGPRSSLYGSEAIGGVIQIFTRKGTNSTTPTLRLTRGSHNTTHATATLSGSYHSRGWFSLGLSGFNTAGINACKGSLTTGCYTIEPDNDGYRNSSAQMRIGWRFLNGANAELNTLHTVGNNEYDGSFSNSSRTVEDIIGTTLQLPLNSYWHLKLLAGQSSDNSDNFLNGVFNSRFNTHRDTVTWQNDVETMQNQLLVAGIDWQNDYVNSSEPYSVTLRKNTGVFSQYLINPGPYSLQLSIREDHDDQFGSTTTGGIAGGYVLRPSFRLTTSFGTAFKAPTFNELYYPGFGNANLQPEKSRSFDIGLIYGVDSRHWSIHVYENDISNLIGFDASFKPVNIDSARIRGIEAEYSKRLLQWEFKAQVNLMDPINKGQGQNNGNILPRRARETIQLNLAYQANQWREGIRFYAVDKRYDDIANLQGMGGYTLVDLFGEYRINKLWQLQGRIANYFNKNYETAYMYNQPGRELFVTLRYQP